MAANPMAQKFAADFGVKITWSSWFVAAIVPGAVGLLLIEEGLKGMTEYWPMILGPLIILMVLGLRRGLWSILPVADHDNATPPAKEKP